MTHFEDGPAKDKTLMLKRAPRFLRVVEENGQFDALDQLDDEPRPNENIYAYERVGEVGMIHINAGRKNHGGLFTMATYRYIKDQPKDINMRNRDQWQLWCKKKEKP